MCSNGRIGFILPLAGRAQTWEKGKTCTDGIDNGLNGLTDCADSASNNQAGK